MKQFFEKTCPSQTPGSIECEVEGLNLISLEFGKTHNLHTPKILYFDKNILRTEFIKSFPKSKKFYENLAINLAKMHKKRYESFGLGQSNFIGLKPQKNILCDNWADFFFEQRLIFQVEMIVDEKTKKFVLEKLKASEFSIRKIISSHNPYPSLVHGDLWSGNIICDACDRAYVIDPAIYYGDREVDLAMTKLFGGFSEYFYSCYNECFALELDYLDRFRVYNLYHLLNHYNIFGQQYLPQVLEVVDWI